MGRPLLDRTGVINGYLKVLNLHRKTKKGAFWVCICTRCSKIRIVPTSKIFTTYSCAECAHQLANIGEFNGCEKERKSWIKMIDRCGNPKSKNWHRYGGRGIQVCERWKKDFWAFMADLGPLPINHTLERINNNDNYCAENCKWATRKEQANNRNTTLVLTIDGVTKLIKDWLVDYKVLRGTYEARVYRAGWSPLKAIITPVKHKKRSSFLNT
jgi:predicted nucleic acid-binding Zn ribbon protein